MMVHSWTTGLATVAILCLALLLLLFVSVIPRRPDDATHTSKGRRLRLSDESGLRLRLVQEKYPWMVRRLFEPNYLIAGNRIRNASSGNVIRDRAVVTVFVHVPRTSGTSLVQCIARLRNSSLLMAPQVTEDYRHRKFGFTSKWDMYDMYAGGAAFGICDEVGHRRPCSYFTILREPFDQAVSSYRHCQTSLGDPQCAVVNANRVGLRQWILLHGGQLFRKFLFNGQICDRSLDDVMSRNEDDSTGEAIMRSGRESCWYKQKMWLRTIADDDRRVLLDYVLDNLERYFAVIGLYEDMDATIKTLQFVYGLPFSECRAKSVSRDVSDVRSCENSAAKTNLSARRCRHSTLEPGLEDTLRNDVLVRKALEDDLRIYQRAREIVAHQNRRLFNRLKL